MINGPQRGRPRNKPVIDPRTGREIPGLYFKKSNRSLYSIPEVGKLRYYGRDLLAGIDRYRRETEGPGPGPIDDAMARRVLLDAGLSDEEIEDKPALLNLAKYGRFQVPLEWANRHLDEPLGRLAVDAKRRTEGFPPLPTPRPPGSQGEIDKGTTGRKSAQRLKDCLADWVEFQQRERISGTYLKDVRRVFGYFVRVLGNLPISELRGCASFCL